MSEAQAGMAWPGADAPSFLRNDESTEAGPSFNASSPLYRATVLLKPPERLLHGNLFLLSSDHMTV